VRAGNDFPVLNGPPLQRVAAGTTYRFDVPAGDPDGDPLTFRLDRGPAGMAVDGLGRVTWPTTLADVGNHEVVLTIADDVGAEIELAYTLQVIADTQRRAWPSRSIPTAPSAPTFSFR
jgi:hypothetical protein